MADGSSLTSTPAGGPDSGLPSETLLTEAGLMFNSRLQLEEIVSQLARRIAEETDADCVLWLQGRQEEGMRLAASASVESARAARWAAGAEAYWVLGEGPIDEAIRHGAIAEAAFTPEASAALASAFGPLGGGPLLAVPLMQGPELLGVVMLVRPEGASPFAPAHRQLLAALAPQAAAGVANARTLAGERWQRQKAELMFQASKAVHTELHFDQAIREIALLLKQSIKAPWVGLLEYHAHEQAFSLLGSTAEPAADLRLASLRLPLAHWPEAERALGEAGGPVAITVPATLLQATGHQAGSAWAFPLEHKQSPQGLLLLLAPQGQRQCAPETAEVAIGIAELVALAIANQHLMDQEAKARIQIIRSQAAAQEREVLLRQIVHDLRNATQAMSLVVEDIELAAGTTPSVLSGLATLNSQITFISNFLKEKLNWIHHGDRTHAQPATALAEVFAELEGRFGPVARAKHQRLVVSAPEPIQVHLSSVQLEQIVGNLLDNAIKYTPEHGEIRLWADHSDGWVTVYVADNGPGIPAADQARLGEVGYRGGAQLQEGTGLGLANVRQLVTRAGGLFGVSSHADAGTTFHVSLPTTTWGRVIS